MPVPRMLIAVPELPAETNRLAARVVRIAQWLVALELCAALLSIIRHGEFRDGAFLALLVCILIMFGSVFFILLGSQYGSRELDDEEDDDFGDGVFDEDDDAESLLAAPFATVEETALTMYRMVSSSGKA